MPACGNCIQPCSCTISEDGIRAGHLELGRNFTQVNGSGTTDDPYVFSFLDQKEFRPRTAEIQLSSRTISSGSTHSMVLSGPDPRGNLLYESPINFVVKDFSSTDNLYRYLGGNFYYIGASVTFAEAADVTSNARQMWLTSVRGNSFPASDYVVGGQTAPGGGQDPLTLQCGGITPGIFFQVPAVGDVTVQFDLSVFQDSGSPIAMSDLKIWVTQI